MTDETQIQNVPPRGPRPPDDRPSSIGRYQVVDVLGSGAMGVVYKAHDPAIGRNVAIKVVRIDADTQEQRAESVDRFRLEVQAAGRCSHPGIVGVFDFLDQDGNPAIVMELVEGASLHGYLRDPVRRATLSVPSIALQMLEALGYAHGQGIIHRDIKPANILLTPSGQVKIADFGIARVSGSNATLAGAMLGTPSYMAPEQVLGDTVDRRADLFAVGAILYEMLTGRPPFAGRTVPQTLLRLSGPEVADLAPVAAAGGHAYLTVLRRALAKDRTQRFQTADAFALEMQAAACAAPAADDDAGDPLATVVLAPRAPRLAGTLAPTPVSHVPVSHVPVSHATVSHVWDPSLLQRVELQLARFVGPMARLMVARAAQQVTAPDELFATLARGLPSASDRSLFLRAVGGGRVEPSLGGTRAAPTLAPRTIDPRTASDPRTTGAPRTEGERTAGAPSTQIPGTMASPAAPASGSVNVSPEAAAAAQAALVVHVGPIARLLVRQAAAQAVSGRDFIDRLCAHVTKPDELTKLRRRLRAEVEPKLA